MAVIDISVPIRSGMIVYEGDPGVRVSPHLEIARGDPANVSMLSMGSHTGTHVDAPAHFVEGAVTLDRVPLDTLVGPALVAAVRAERLISAADLASVPLDGHTRLLLKTRNSSLYALDRFSRDYVALGLDAAQFLVERGIKLVGIDYLSIEAFSAQGHPVHKCLLGAGMIILEGLNLGDVEPGIYELLCLPIPVRGGDGAPCRAVLRSLRS